MKTVRFSAIRTAVLALLISLLWVAKYAHGAGVTIVTHGFQLTELDHDHGWVNAMTDYIADRAGGNAAVYSLDLTLDGDTILLSNISTGGKPPTQSQNAEVVIRLFWDELANVISPYDTTEVAQRALPFILSASSGTGISSPLGELPIHVIGHSRGGSLASELCRLLGEKGIWVHQMTTLDPHPVDLYFDDAAVHVYENVLFADNYYQTMSSPEGQYLSGAFNRQLTSLAGGYGDTGTGNHSDVHLWYHGTVNTDMNASDGPQSFTTAMRESWYTSGEFEGWYAGFFYSRLGVGFEEQEFLPSGYYNDGDFNNSPANRVALNRQTDEWPSLIRLCHYATRALAEGESLPVEYVFQSYDNPSTTTLYLDLDQNPYNNENEIALILPASANPQTLTARGTRTVNVNATIPSSASADTYFLYAKIVSNHGNTALNKTRYLYSAQTVQITSSKPSAPSGISAIAVSSSQINLGWRDNSANETGFKIERRLGSSGTWTQIATRSANVTTYSDTGLAAGALYQYQVRAYNVSGNSTYSSIASATTQPSSGTTHTLTIASVNPGSGVGVSSYVGSGLYAQGTTPTSRTFAHGSEVGVSAFYSTLPSGQVFQKWQLDGVDYAYVLSTSVTLDANHTLTAVYGATALPVRTLSSLAIEGPSSVNERSSAQYSARATYSDGSSGYVTPAWDINTSYASISSSGLLDTDEVSSDKDIEIEAAFTLGGVTRSATKDVTIYNTDVVSTYTLTRNSTVGGSIGYSPRASSYAAGTVVSLHGNPSDDYIFDYWSGDASGTEDDITITMNGNKSVTAHFTMDTSYGRLQVNLSPPQAVTEGAQWKYSSFTAWQDSGYMMDGITPRTNKSIYFKDIPGWIAPDSVKASVVGGHTTVTNATYREILGGVQVTLSPAQASVAGARWRLDGGAWQESGVTLPDISTGNHVIHFLAVSGWTAPTSQTVSVARGVVSTRNGDFVPPAGLPIITSVSPRTGPIEGGTTVIIDGVNFLPGASVTFGGVAAVSITVVSSTRITAVTPSRASYGTVALALTSGGQTVTQANGFSYLNALGSNIELVGQIGGNVEAVAVVGNMVYYGEGPCLVASDFSNSATPVERGRIALPTPVKDIVVVSNIAYVAIGAAGMYAVDISTPASPAIVGFFDTDGSASAVTVVNGIAYIADGSAGLQVLSVTNPASIVRLGLLDTAGNATRIAAGTIGAKKYAFVAESYSDGAALRVVEVTIPSNPVELTNVPAQSFNGFSDVKLVGTTLYAGGWGTLKIYDASNPTSLVQRGTYGNVGNVFIDVVGNRLYTCDGNLNVADLSVTPNPPNLGYFDVGANYCFNLIVANNLAFAAMGRDGLSVIAVSSPASMTLRSAIKTMGDVDAVKVSGTVGYVGDGSGLHTIDISNPARPLRLATLSGARVTDIVVASGKATLINGTKTVRIVNVANPAALSLFGTYTNIWANSLALMGSTPILAGVRALASLPKLDVLNLSTPSNPQSTGSLILDTTNVNGIGITIASNWAFVGRESKALDVVNLANPAIPQKVGTIIITNFFEDVAASEDGNFVYVRDVILGIQVVDVTTKTSPVLGQVINPPQAVGAGLGSVLVVGNRLFSTQGGFIFLFDITNPASPQTLGYYDIPGRGAGIAVVGDLIFVAGSYSGVTILRIKDVDKPTLAITSPTVNPTYSATNGVISIGGTASDDKGVTRVTWLNDRGGGGVATGTTTWAITNLQLAAGLNRVTVTAEDAQGNLGTDMLEITATFTDSTPPVVTITGPKPDGEFTVTTNIITLSGSAADNQAVSAMTCSNNYSAAGTVTLVGQNWSVTNIQLALGPNYIQVTARDASGNSATDTALIFLVPPDTNAPTINIEFPTISSTFETRTDTINVSGTAEDNTQVSEVRWTRSGGTQGVANGVSPWSVNTIPLQPGFNLIEVSAMDAVGNVSADTLSVTYTPAAQISVTPASRSVTATTGTTTFAITNTGGGIMVYSASESESWLSITNGGIGTNNGTLTISYDANPNTTTRTGTVTVSASEALGSPVNITVVQAGAASSGWDVGYQPIGGGWRRLSWFGDYVPMGGDGWIWHNKHGFFFVPTASTSADLWLYAMDMGWLYTGNTLYPFIYRSSPTAWLWYNGSTNPRWFMNMTASTWESRP